MGWWTEDEWARMRAGDGCPIFKAHVCEMHELDQQQRAAFWDDVATAARAVVTAFGPVKIDNLVMGHRCPHLHCHVYPQYETDDPFAPVDISAGSVRLTPVERQVRIGRLRALMLD